jgi:hypothetical protein
MNLEIITKEEIMMVEQKLDRLIELVQGSDALGDKKIYSTQELARELSVSIKTIQNWREQQLIEFSQVGHKIFYTGKAVGEFLASHSIKRNAHRYSKQNYLRNNQKSFL